MKTTTDMIEAFEEQTGLAFDANGPDLIECECGSLVQYIPDHECYITQGARLEARYGGHGVIEE